MTQGGSGSMSLVAREEKSGGSLFRWLTVANEVVDSECGQQQKIENGAGNRCLNQNVNLRCECDDLDLGYEGKTFEMKDIADIGPKITQ